MPPTKDQIRRFYQQLKEQWLPTLNSLGFKGRPWRFGRMREPFFDFVSVQDRQIHDGCFMNLGVHLTFLENVDGRRIDIQPIDALESTTCAINRRLRRSDGSEKWPYSRAVWWKPWDSNAAVDRCVSRMLKAFAEQAIPFFEAFSSLPGPFERIRLSDIKSGRAVAIPYVSAFIPAPGDAYFMAQVYRHVGDARMAKAFAEAGLQLAEQHIAAAGDRRTERDLRPIRARLSEIIASC